ncbi:hypothetical protein KAR91_84705 [Candidatus Pacearchaeota archaeon]|nr:hypothetical protein [Candidatus Pacearchaeota archaeon]
MPLTQKAQTMEISEDLLTRLQSALGFAAIETHRSKEGYISFRKLSIELDGYSEPAAHTIACDYANYRTF